MITPNLLNSFKYNNLKTNNNQLYEPSHDKILDTHPDDYLENHINHKKSTR